MSSLWEDPIAAALIAGLYARCLLGTDSHTAAEHATVLGT
jgi:hypothetical protein